SSALNSILPESIEVCRVRRVIPRTHTVALPFLKGAHHGLVMRSAHDDTVLIRQLSVQRVVLIERAVPHGGPQVIRLQPKQQFKDSLIKQMIEAAVFFVDPIRERWGLIIEENPAILYGGFTFDVSSRLDVQRIVMRDRNIRPPI